MSPLGLGEPKMVVARPQGQVRGGGPRVEGHTRLPRLRNPSAMFW